MIMGQHYDNVFKARRSTRKINEHLTNDQHRREKISPVKTITSKNLFLESNQFV